MLIYRCPTTGRTVHSSIETSAVDVRRLGAVKLSLGVLFVRLATRSWRGDAGRLGDCELGCPALTLSSYLSQCQRHGPLHEPLNEFKYIQPQMFP
jgi:hypothetical protein